MHSRICRCPVTLALLAVLAMTVPLRAQQDNPVYVDDSPQAWELFRRAADQSRDNTAEAVRLYQELLDDFALKLIPVRENEPDQFQCVRLRVLGALRSDDNLLERYRLIQTAEAQRMLEADQLEELAMTRSLTDPGLEALLMLAQRDLESARFWMAMSWLDQALTHPDLSGRRAAHAWYMAGLAAHHLGQIARWTSAREALVQLGSEGAAFVQQLDALAADAQAPPINVGVSPLDVGQAADLTDLVPQAIWTMPLDDSLLARRFANAPPQDEQTIAQLQQRLRMADLTTIAPTVAGETVYVNEGHTVLALNRLTGRQTWSYSDLARIDLVEGDEDAALDMNVVAVEGDSLVTLTGHAGNTSRTNQGRVICLDVGTGRLRWAASLSGLGGEDTEALYPHGAPIVAEGMVYVAARRVSPQLLTSAYVIALDLADGRVRWVQYLTSSGGLRQAPRPYCTIAYKDGSLYVASAVGATARLEAGTGQARWLRRTNVPLSQSMLDQGRRPWEMTAPAVTRRGVMTVLPDQRRVLLLDLENGDQLESHPVNTSEAWNSPRYLLADEHRVYAVGSEIRAFTLEALDHPVWRLPAAAVQQSPEQRELVEPLELRGRVQLVASGTNALGAPTPGALIVPNADGIQVVDSETGRVTHTLSVDTIGNPLAIDSQLIVAGGNQLDSYMSFNRAERMLRERMSLAPNDPEPALSLLRLGIRVRNFALTMEATGLASQAINRLGTSPESIRQADQTRNELFALLLDLTSSGILTGDDEGEQVFAAIGAVAAEPDQRVEYLLAYGDWLSARSTLRAVETYQAILHDPMLAGTQRSERGARRDAGAWAVEHLRALIETHGETAYAPQADYAAMRLDQIQSSAQASADELTALAMEYPFAPAAADAALVAAGMHARHGHNRAALAVLARTWEMAPASTAAGRLLGAFVQMCREAGWDAQAQMALEHVLRTRGDMELVGDAGSRTASDWLASMQPQGSATRLPRVGLSVPGDQPINAQARAGVTLPWNGSAPRDQVLVGHEDGVSLMSINAMNAPVWTNAVAADPSGVLMADDERILLWTDENGDEPRAVMLNARDGTVRWTSQPLGAIVANPVGELARIRGPQERMPDGDMFDPRQTLALANGRTLIMMQRTGAAAAIDAGDGSTVLWKSDQLLDQIHLAVLTDDSLVLTGISRSVDAGGKAGESGAAIVVLDPLSGNPVFESAPVIRPLGRGGVRWMALGPMGRLVYGTAEGIEAIDLLTGQRLWTSTEFAAVQSQRGWIGGAGTHVVIEDQRGRLRTVDAARGTMSAAFDQPGRSDWEPLELKNVMFVGDHVVAHYRQRVVVFDMTGVMVGADVITDEREYQWLLPAEQCLVLISRRTLQVIAPEQAGRRTQHIYRIYTLSHNGRVLGDPLELSPLPDRVQNVQLTDGWLLMSTQSDTLAIPMSAQ